MIIAIDYDGTYSSDPDCWDKIINLLQSNNHKVYCVTKRYPAYSQDIKDALKIPIIYARQSKIVATKNVGIEVDIWIENNPASILPYNQRKRKYEK
jgi:hydroxymethylpyrimidine pyrophosphatase-like HAD family hydrolase|tara:strand:+ start:426 stop:713 length:288 start_codon:yes stop_codon:yes gene_type:complete